MAKGQKSCPNPSCKAICGCRTLVCPSCGADFGIKEKVQKPQPIVVAKPKPIPKQSVTKVVKLKRRKKRKQEKIDWRTLDVGDRIKVLSGGGQRHISGDVNIPMGYKGKFLVKGIRPDGILAYSGNEGGYCFIHMGPKRVIDSGILLRPHKILLIEKRPERVLSNAS
jgi:hypothetical protein